LRVEELLKTLESYVKNTNKIIKLLKDYQKSRSEPVNNAYVLEKKIQTIEKHLPEKGDQVWVRDLRHWLAEEKENVVGFKDEFRIKFGQELSTLFHGEGKKIKGQYPVIRIGLYSLNIDFQFGTATLYYGPEIEKIRSNILLQPEVIFRTVKDFDEKLRDQRITAAGIYENLHSAYKRGVVLNKLSFGDKIPIMKVLNEYVLLQQSNKFFADPQRNNFRECSRVTLSYLMYFLKKSELCQKNIRFHVATFDATVDKKNALWIPDNEDGEGTHYSHISFLKDS
jgi:hypothetical protein